MNPVTAAPDSGRIAPMSGPATIGESCVDRYLPPIGLDAPGGNALNVAAGLAAAGLTVAHVGAVATTTRAGSSSPEPPSAASTRRTWPSCRVAGRG
jgi:hypothetical protein